MQEAGYKGEKVVLTAHLVPDRIAQGAVVIQAQLQAAGMNVEVKTLESAALQEVWNKGEFELFYSGLTPRPDADVYYCQTNESKSSQAGYNSADYDRLCQEGRKAAQGRGSSEDLRPARAAAAHGSPLLPDRTTSRRSLRGGRTSRAGPTGRRATPACGESPSNLQARPLRTPWGTTHSRVARSGSLAARRAAPSDVCQRRARARPAEPRPGPAARSGTASPADRGRQDARIDSGLAHHRHAEGHVPRGPRRAGGRGRRAAAAHATSAGS